MKNLIKITVLFLAINTTQAQEFEIDGIVSDKEGSLPGASVLLKGTNKRVETDFDGYFKILLKKGNVLVFSFIGMRDKEVVITNKNSVKRILLKEGNDLIACQFFPPILGVPVSKKVFKSKRQK